MDLVFDGCSSLCPRRQFFCFRHVKRRTFDGKRFHFLDACLKLSSVHRTKLSEEFLDECCFLLFLRDLLYGISLSHRLLPPV